MLFTKPKKHDENCPIGMSYYYKTSCPPTTHEALSLSRVTALTAIQGHAISRIPRYLVHFSVRKDLKLRRTLIFQDHKVFCTYVEVVLFDTLRTVHKETTLIHQEFCYVPTVKHTPLHNRSRHAHSLGMEMEMRMGVRMNIVWPKLVWPSSAIPCIISLAVARALQASDQNNWLAARPEISLLFTRIERARTQERFVAREYNCLRRVLIDTKFVDVAIVPVFSHSCHFGCHFLSGDCCLLMNVSHTIGPTRTLH